LHGKTGFLPDNLVASRQNLGHSARHIQLQQKSPQSKNYFNKYSPKIHRKLYCALKISLHPFKKRFFQIFILFLPGFNMEEVDKCGAGLCQPHPQPRPFHTHNSSAAEKMVVSKIV
jgi:hypothetical protein